MTHTPRGLAMRTGLVVLSMLGIGVSLGGCPSPRTDETPEAPDVAEYTAPDEALDADSVPVAEPPGERDAALPEDAADAERVDADAPPDDTPPPPDDSVGDEPDGEPSADALRLDTTVESSTSIAEAVSIEEWEGVLVHDATGMSFPKSAAGWTRLGSKRYDAEGHDVGIGYTRMWRSSLAAATVYLYPRGPSRDGRGQQSAAEHLDDVARQIGARHGDVEVVSRVGGRTGLRGVPVRFGAAEHELPGGPELFGRRAASFTSVIAARAWWIKVRVTTPVESRDVALAAVEELLAELRLPATGLPATQEVAAEDAPDAE